MSFIETRCRLCTDEILTNCVSFLDTDIDHLKYKYKLKILFEDLILEEDDKTPFMLCLFCVEKIRNAFEFRKQCLEAYQFWGIQLGRDQSKSIDLNFKIIPSVDNQYTRYEFLPTNSTEPSVVSMEENSPIKKEIIEDPVPLVGNMKNKLSSLLKLAPLETKKSNMESNAEAATGPILSLTLLSSKRTYARKTESPKIPKIEEVPKSVIKPILDISKLKQNLNQRINIAIKPESMADDDDDMPLKTLKRKLSDINAAANNTMPSGLKLNIFSLKNKLGTALKVGESLQEQPLAEEKKKLERRPKKHGFIVDINNIIADKKNNIYYCKYCYKYFENVVALRYHVVLHSKLKPKKETTKTVEKTVTKTVTETVTTVVTTVEKVTEKNGKKTSQCDICDKWFINVLMHKAKAHKKTDKSKN